MLQIAIALSVLVAVVLMLSPVGTESVAVLSVSFVYQFYVKLLCQLYEHCAIL